jgi:hypothetical protein
MMIALETKAHLSYLDIGLEPLEEDRPREHISREYEGQQDEPGVVLREAPVHAHTSPCRSFPMPHRAPATSPARALSNGDREAVPGRRASSGERAAIGDRGSVLRGKLDLGYSRARGANVTRRADGERQPGLSTRLSFLGEPLDTRFPFGA